MDHDVGPVFDGADDVRSAERVVDDQRNAVTVSYFCHGLDAYQVRVRVAERLDEDGLGVGPDGLFEIIDVRRVDKRRGDAKCRQCVCQQVVGAAVDCLGRHNVVAGRRDVLERVGDCRRARCHGQSGHAAFEGSHALFENALRRVGQAAVDVAGVLEAEARFGVRGVVEDIRCGLINRHCARIGCRVGLLLACMELDGLEFEFSCVFHSFYFFCLSLIFVWRDAVRSR